MWIFFIMYELKQALIGALYGDIPKMEKHSKFCIQTVFNGMSSFGLGFSFLVGLWSSSSESTSNRLFGGGFPVSNKLLESGFLAEGPSVSFFEESGLYLGPNSFLIFVKTAPFGGPEWDSLDLASAALGFWVLFDCPLPPLVPLPLVFVFSDAFCRSFPCFVPALVWDEFWVMKGELLLLLFPSVLCCPAELLLALSLSLWLFKLAAAAACFACPCRHACISFCCMTLLRALGHTLPFAPDGGNNLPWALLSTGVIGCLGIPRRFRCEEESLRSPRTLLKSPRVLWTLMVMSSTYWTWRWKRN